MAPRLSDSWSNRNHGTSKSPIDNMILAQLLLTEAAIATTEALLLKTTLELANLKSEMLHETATLSRPQFDPVFEGYQI